MPEKTISDKGLFRFRDWWWSKTTMLLGMVYLFAIWFKIPFFKFLPLLFFSLITIAGFASFGYLINDLFDIRSDLLAGKKNFLIGKSPAIITVYMAITLLLVFLPWFYLPADNLSIYIILLQLLLFILYSAPPFRLKELGIAGLIVDALYAHALPILLAAYTFSLAAKREILSPELVLLFAWQFTCGLRNILIHQSEDAYSDKLSAVSTFAAQLSAQGLRFAIRYLILTETLFSSLFFLLLAVKNQWLISVLVVLIYTSLKHGIFSSNGMYKLLKGTFRYYPNFIYEKWFPLIFLFIKSISSPYFVIIIFLHTALFNFENTWGKVPYEARKLHHSLYLPAIDFFRSKIRIGVNYAIYYFFLFFQVDLIKEKTSAAGYLEKKFRRKK